jgi:hypothetical protein
MDIEYIGFQSVDLIEVAKNWTLWWPVVNIRVEKFLD